VEEPTRSRDHTERMLKGMGARIEFDLSRPADQPHRVSIEGGAELSSLDLTVPGDFSSAAFLIAAALIVPGSELLVRDVNLNPTRTGFLEVIKRMGADVKVVRLEERCGEPIGDLLVKSSSLRGTSVAPDEIPLLVDEIPVLSVLATQAEGETSVRGAEELRVKETDRIAAVSSELKKMGASVEEQKDGLIIRGRSSLKGAPVKSYDDHRMAMSLAVAALVAEGDTRIEAFDCIGISYPAFPSDLKAVEIHLMAVVFVVGVRYSPAPETPKPQDPEPKEQPEIRNKTLDD
jgi:3-phosphoshikimate 1-carboxyvinyltransferase